jgi:hypothetical protein
MFRNRKLAFGKVNDLGFVDFMWKQQWMAEKRSKVFGQAAL